MLPIDNLYLNGIGNFYQQATNTRNEIWPEMELSPVCLFRINGPAILYNHPNPPATFIKIDEKTSIGTQKELNLFGATQVEINGILTAIVDYGQEHYSTPEEMYAELLHEIHHVYQRNKIKTIEYDNPATLLIYPENKHNDAMKLYEQQLLLKMATLSDRKQFNNYLNQFYSCRIKRESIIGQQFMKYEKTVENLEGPAFYCEYKFYNFNNSPEKTIKENYNEKHFWSLLNTPYYGRTNLRLRHLASGMAMCYILDKYHHDWKNEYYAGKTDLFNFFMSKFNPQVVDLPNLDVYNSLSDFHTTKLIQQRQLDYNLFANKSGIKVILEFNSIPQFRGFDPMHAIAINDSLILHSTLLSLKNEDNSLFINNNEVATEVSEQIWFVKKVMFYIENKSSLTISDEKIVVETNGINLVWEGKITSEEDNRITIKCK
jgi:hypothetical protein